MFYDYSMVVTLYKIAEVFFRLLRTNGFQKMNDLHLRARVVVRISELTHRQLLLNDAVGFRDMSAAHALKGT